MKSLTDTLISRFLPKHVTDSFNLAKCCDDDRCPDANPLPKPEMVQHLARFWRTRALCGLTSPFGLLSLRGGVGRVVTIDGAGMRSMGDFRKHVRDTLKKNNVIEGDVQSLTFAFVTEAHADDVDAYNKAVRSGEAELPPLRYSGRAEAPANEEINDKKAKLSWCFSVFHEDPDGAFPLRTFSCPIMPSVTVRRDRHSILKALGFTMPELDTVRPVSFYGDLMENRRGIMKPRDKEDCVPVLVEA